MLAIRAVPILRVIPRALIIPKFIAIVIVMGTTLRSPPTRELCTRAIITITTIRDVKRL